MYGRQPLSGEGVQVLTLVVVVVVVVGRGGEGRGKRRRLRPCLLCPGFFYCRKARASPASGAACYYCTRTKHFKSTQYPYRLINRLAANRDIL